MEKLKLLKDAPETGIEQLRAKAIEYMLRLSVKKGMEAPVQFQRGIRSSHTGIELRASELSVPPAPMLPEYARELCR